MQRRKIKENERAIIDFLLVSAKLNPANFNFVRYVEEYEGYVMGSIGLGNADLAQYDGDIFQAKYIDSDGKKVIITLTKDTNGELLDLDFWKEDFSKLLVYPRPEDLIIE